MLVSLVMARLKFEEHDALLGVSGRRRSVSRVLRAGQNQLSSRPESLPGVAMEALLERRVCS